MPTLAAPPIAPVPATLIERRIYMIRSHKVMLDSDLAELYRVETFNLNKAVKRNLQRFPEDFMFQLTPLEWEGLRFQIGMSKTESDKQRGGRRYLPYAFTEQGVAMLSSVLSSERAIEVNIAIMRAFVHLRQFLASHQDVAQRIEALDRAQKEQGSHIEAIWQAIQRLIEPPVEPKRRIGFQASVGKHAPGAPAW